MGVPIAKTTDFTGFKPEHRALFDVFERLGIAHETWEHPPIFTVEEGVALNLHGQIPGMHGKNLFLTNKADELWLVVAREETRVDLKTLSDRLETKRFSFAKPEVMIDVLGVTPGSATPFALMNDTGRRVKVAVEEAFGTSELCVFHPLVNTHSTVIAYRDLLSFIRHFGYEPRIVPLA